MSDLLEVFEAVTHTQMQRGVAVDIRYVRVSVCLNQEELGYFEVLVPSREMNASFLHERCRFTRINLINHSDHSQRSFTDGQSS